MLRRLIPVLILLAFVPAACVAQPIPIDANDDGFHTTPGTLFNPNPLLPSGFPSGFFGTKGDVPSDPIPGPLPSIPVGPGPDLVPVPVITTFLTGPGCHTGMVNIHCYQQTSVTFDLVDTVVHRGGGTLNGTLPLSITLVHLSLRSVSPVTVTYGGANPSQYNIIVELDGLQPSGTVTLTQTSASSGLMDTVLPVNYKVRFVGTQPGDHPVSDVTGLKELLQSTGNTFNVTPQPCSFGLNSPGATAAPGGDQLSVTVNATSAFCNWPTQTTVTWIILSQPLSRTGSSTVQMAVLPNTSLATRIATVTLAGLGFTITQPGGAPGLQLITVAPCRVFDSRNASGPLGGPLLGGGTTRTIPVPSSSCGIPASASAYSLNVTVVPRSGTLGFLTVWPAGQSQPNVSTLNSPDGSILANAAIVPAGAAGAISAFALNDTELIVDINGYFVPPAGNSLQFFPLPPCRVLDTRNANGTFGGPRIVGGTSRSFPFPSSSCGVPANAAAYSLNVTAVPQGFLGFVTAFPTGQPLPNVSTLNSLDGTILANAAIVPAGASGAVSFYANNTTNLVVDINGYFAPPATGGRNFFSATPCRLVDTRNANGLLGGPIMTGGATRTFPLPTSSCGLPPPSAYSLNVTVVPSGPLGFVTVWPTGQTQPFVSTLNAPKGIVVANAALVPAGTNASVDVFVLQSTHVIIDTNGYFQ